MAHFYAEIQGKGTRVTRTGTKNSGMVGHIRGWDVGVRINCFYDENTGRDVIEIEATGGSRGAYTEILLAEIISSEEGPPEIIINPELCRRIKQRGMFR